MLPDRQRRCALYDDALRRHSPARTELIGELGLDYYLGPTTILFGRYQHIAFDSTLPASQSDTDVLRLGVRLRYERPGVALANNVASSARRLGPRSSRSKARATLANRNPNCPPQS
jgi:hypothetical protein